MGGDSFDGTPDQIPSIRTIQRSVQGLCEAGWLISGYRKGSKKPYSVEICNYIPVADDDAGVTLIRPTETKSWAETSVCRVADEDSGGDGERTVSGRGKGGLNETSSETAYKTSSETSSNETSTGGVSESSGVESPTSSASSITSDDDPTPQGITRQVSIDEVEWVKYLTRECFDLLPSQSVLNRIFNAHPDFVWTMDTYKVLKAKLSGGSWKKSIKTPDDLAYRWASDGDTSLFAQVCRDLPDPNPLESSAAESVDMTIEDVREPDPEPEPETVEQTTARTRAFEIYSGGEIPAVVEAFIKKDARYRLYSELYGYHDGKTWKLGNNLTEVESNCEADQRRATAGGEKETVPVTGKKFEMEIEEA